MLEHRDRALVVRLVGIVMQRRVKLRQRRKRQHEKNARYQRRSDAGE